LDGLIGWQNPLYLSFLFACVEPHPFPLSLSHSSLQITTKTQNSFSLLTGETKLLVFLGNFSFNLNCFMIILVSLLDTNIWFDCFFSWTLLQESIKLKDGGEDSIGKARLQEPPILSRGCYWQQNTKRWQATWSCRLLQSYRLFSFS